MYQKIAYFLLFGSMVGCCYFVAAIVGQLADLGAVGMRILACVILAGALAFASMILYAAIARHEQRKRARRVAARQAQGQHVGTF